MVLYRNTHQVFLLSVFPVEVVGIEPTQHAASALQTDMTRHLPRTSILAIMIDYVQSTDDHSLQ